MRREYLRHVRKESCLSARLRHTGGVPAGAGGTPEGIIVQTVGEIEDSLDFEGMQEAEALHKKHFYEMAEKLRKICPQVLPLGCGCCTVCKTCAGPEGNCRFPEKESPPWKRLESWSAIYAKVMESAITTDRRK